MQKKFFLATLLLFLSIWSLAQDDVTRSQLASKYYFNKAYGKAVDLYKKLYEENYSKVYFDRYLKCLKELEQYNKAEKLVSQQISRSTQDLTYYVDLGLVYEAQNNYEKAEETYNKAIDKIQPSRNAIVNLGNAFLNNGRYAYAESLYNKASGMLPDTDFHFQLASVYMMQRKYDKMIGEYLDLLEKNPSRKEDIQNRMQYINDNETTSDIHSILRRKLLQRIRKHPSQGSYYSMLIWLYEQQKDFKSALRQAKAIDMRNNLQGRKVYKVANLALSNEAYEVAEEAYRYNIDKGPHKPYYWPSRTKLLDVMFQRITKGNTPQRKELLRIEQDYANTIKEANPGNRRAQMLKKLAHIRAFYLEESQEALQTINEALNMGNINAGLYAKCQLEKGDIQVKKGDVWDAVLLYAKIEKDNKNNPQGFSAKYRKARLAYFTGDFEWAQAQLDVLKASTSKLIANDAFKLAELIDDNTQQDTAGNALRIYARADMYLWQRKDSLAFITLDSIRSTYPRHALTDEVYHKKAEIYQKRGQYGKAITYYEKTFQEFGSDIYGDASLFQLAKIYEEQKEEYSKAMDLYRKVLEQYPGSIYVSESRQRFRKLRGDM